MGKTVSLYQRRADPLSKFIAAVADFRQSIHMLFVLFERLGLTQVRLCHQRICALGSRSTGVSILVVAAGASRLHGHSSPSIEDVQAVAASSVSHGRNFKAEAQSTPEDLFSTDCGCFDHMNTVWDPKLLPVLHGFAPRP